MKAYSIPENIAISDSGFIFLPTTGETFTLNETGKTIFKYFQQKRNLDEIINSLLDEYEIDRLTLERDLEDFILRLKSLNLLVEL
ncbi:MAG: PqqD family protein [Ignavibacterium sp.]|nr:PqqD family protein [Ignavibacterium sp.]MCX7612135.1 PqqD family protein [Ignavibacterium sp.]MDW8375114.1 PqqD family protein [Ignavibacteriales bacterium]